MSVWHWPQWTIAVIYGLSLVLAPLGVNKPKKPKSESDAVLTALVVVALIFVLWCGGFWT